VAFALTAQYFHLPNSDSLDFYPNPRHFREDETAKAERDTVTTKLAVLEDALRDLMMFEQKTTASKLPLSRPLRQSELRR
jgi:hypothetical protein